MGTSARFNRPYAVAVDPAAGAFALVADYKNHRIRRIDLLAGGAHAVSTLAGDGTWGVQDGTNEADNEDEPPPKASTALAAPDAATATATATATTTATMTMTR